jgi:hypothetical protein
VKHVHYDCPCSVVYDQDSPWIPTPRRRTYKYRGGGVWELVPAKPTQIKSDPKPTLIDFSFVNAPVMPNCTLPKVQPPEPEPAPQGWGDDPLSMVETETESAPVKHQTLQPTPPREITAAQMTDPKLDLLP